MKSTPAKKFRNPRAKNNFQGRSCSIAAVGSYVPERILCNADLEKMVDTSDEWIVSRTGIRERRIAAQDEYTSDLAAKAALLAMERAKIKGEQIDLIILATITPDMPFPATACLVQQKIGARRAFRRVTRRGAVRASFPRSGRQCSSPRRADRFARAKACTFR